MSVIPYPNTPFQYTEPANPTFTYGQGIESTREGREWAEGEKLGWKVIDTSKEDRMQVYKFMISGIIPRPIAYVSSVSEAGVENIAPFSWFNMYSLTVAPVFKEDALNVRATKQFVVNLVSEPWIMQANSSAVDAPVEMSEWSLSGLNKAPSIHIKPPRVKESAFSMECELMQAIDLVNPVHGGQSTATMFIGHVKYIHIRKDVLNDQGLVDPGKPKPVVRMGDISYARTTEAYKMERPSWALVGEQIETAFAGGLAG